MPVVHGGSRLGERLVDAKVLTEEQVAHALTEQRRTGKRLGSVLVESGAIDERTLLSALGMQLELPIIDLRHNHPTADALERVPEGLVRTLNALPLHIEGDHLDVVVAEPPDAATSAELERAAGIAVRVLLAPSSEIRLAINGAYAASELPGDTFEATTGSAPSAPVAASQDRALDATSSLIDPQRPADAVADAIIADAWKRHATDVHLDPQLDAFRVRYRVDGALRDALSLPLDRGWDILDRIKGNARLDMSETRRAQLGAFDLEVGGQRLDVRVATSGTVLGEKATLVLSAPEKALDSLDVLGLTTEARGLLRGIARGPMGLVLCVGPMRSGRTTTLYAMLAEADTTDRSVFSVEKHLEHVVTSVNQIEAGEPADFTLADGIRAALQQDADVILVDEIGDAATASLATQAAIDGRLVLGSMHAGDAVGLIHRMIDLHVDPSELAAAVVLVVGQRLVRRVCSACTAPYVPPPAELGYFRHRVQARKSVFAHGEGCDACAGTGYRGRTGLFELFRVDDRVRDLIASRAPTAALRDVAAGDGMRTLQDEGLRLVSEGVTTIAEIIRSLSALEIQR